ncbi:VOC family protein [[Eubacterium] cellulosolvens]
MVSLEHVAITVENLDKAIDFYSDVFGFSLLKKKEKSELGITYALLQNDNLRIELIEPLTINSVKENIEENQDLVTKLCDGKGLNHLSIKVKNLNEIVDKLEKKGAKKIAELGSKDGSSKLIFYADIEGNMIELIQST